MRTVQEVRGISGDVYHFKKERMNLDELIYQREQARQVKDYSQCDKLRQILDDNLIFVFDTTWGQQIFYLIESYFKRKPEQMSNRKFVEYRIQQDSRAERILEGWITTQRSNI